MEDYLSSNGVSIVIHPTVVRIITKNRIDVMERVLYISKELVVFLLKHNISSPQAFNIITPDEEIGGFIDAIAYSPDEQLGFLTLKGLYYVTK